MDVVAVESTLTNQTDELARAREKIAKLAAALSQLVTTTESLKTENQSLRVAHRGCSDTVGRMTGELAESRARETTYWRRPPVLRGRTVQTNVGCGPLYITLNEDERGRPFEVFFKLGKSGSCQQSYLEALGVAMSVGLRYGADPQKYIEKFAGMRCPNPKMRSGDGAQTLSCADGISQGLAKAISLAVALPGFEDQVTPDSPVHTVAEPVGTTRLLDTASTSKPTLVEDTSGEALSGAALGVALRNGGAGLCPKCSGPLISRGGCVDCASQCGYVGKCG